MISDDEVYERTRNAMAILERGLASMTRRRPEYGPNFHFDAVQVVEEILKLREQIDEMIGLTAFLKEFGPPSDASTNPATPSAPPAIESLPLPAAG